MPRGFLGYPTTFMLDFVVCALVLVVPLLVLSLFQVKFRRQYAYHRNLQMLLAGVLLLAVVLFELDVQFLHGGWQNIVAQRATPLTPDEFAFVRNLLYVHLVFAISTPFLWALTLYEALRRFPSPPQPSAHSARHRLFGWLATLDLVATSVTGLIWYYFAFIA